MTKNQFLTDANTYLKFIKGNYAESTYYEKTCKLRYYAEILYSLCQEGTVSSCNPNDQGGHSRVRHVQALVRDRGPHHMQGSRAHRRPAVLRQEQRYGGVQDLLR